MPDIPAATSQETVEGKSPAGQRPRARRPEILPPVAILDVIGLVEAIHNEGGSADLFDLNEELSLHLGRTLYLVKAAELLDLVETPKQRVVLTKEGLEFVISDINARKKMLHDVFSTLTIVQIATDILKESDIVRLPVSDLVQRFQEMLPNEDAEQLVNILIAWGRYAEYFGYNDDTKTIYLDIGQEMRA
jgi:NitT/TauT family transport system ATP-binding protein